MLFYRVKDERALTKEELVTVESLDSNERTYRPLGLGVAIIVLLNSLVTLSTSFFVVLIVLEEASR